LLILHFATGWALKLANEELNRGRNDTKKMIILLTDGVTTASNKIQLKYVATLSLYSLLSKSMTDFD